MSEQEAESGFSLIPFGSRELAAPRAAQNRILGEMVESSLALARESVVAPRVDLDELVRRGKQLQHGQGMTPENIQAFQLFHQAAVAGHPEAQFLVYECYFDGHGVPESAQWHQVVA